ncbi:MAG: hypothetical protein KGL48_00295 [Sphingomonadales bacterium]|nr:hypothetical protein [Sphingomonadales bacterium]MDE2569556.1 hypothetical protein [Sphingomonadales bacterium]
MPAAEQERIAAMSGEGAWRRWGPYLSERQWGTVREDYSADGDAWAYFPHDHARSRAYRWGEDGIAGFSDDRQKLCLSLALWNGRDPILKERLFGLTNAEGNHGEDVKELYWYLDGVPSHALMRMLYKYPQAAFPYDDLLRENAARGLDRPEYEIADTGVFDEGRYFDIAVDYAKAAPDDVLMLVSVTNRGPDPATLHVLPHVWFRNTWSWREDAPRPLLQAKGGGIAVDHPDLGPMRWDCDAPGAELLFCDNETNPARLPGEPREGWWKDGINDAVVGGRADAVNPARCGTKAAAHAVLDLAPGETRQVRVRLRLAGARGKPFAGFDAVMATRRAEADAYYADLQADIVDPERRLVQRQALAGMLWSKQFYGYDVWRWLQGDPAEPAPPPGRGAIRNGSWKHLAMGDVDPHGGDILAMPDCWEYPWFASWDLAFHAATLALVDADYAKAQLLLLTQPRALHPNGQMAAYEWNFGDVNPPVSAWAALRVFAMDRDATGVADYAFLRRIFHKLLLNFTWWVNREDAEGNNLFEGGFLGLDNISLFDATKPLPGGGTLEQSDGTAWAAMYALGMMRIAIELAATDEGYEDLVAKFFEHFVYIAAALHGESAAGGHCDGLWDEEDQFYYNTLRVPGHAPQKLRVRSIAGLLPILAVMVLPHDFDRNLPGFAARSKWFLDHRPDYAGLVSDWESPGPEGRRLLSLLRKHRLNAVLTRMLDEGEFLSPHGVRSLSKVYESAPYVFDCAGERFVLDYEPGEGTTRIYGGNSNWRGPVWIPLNFLLIEALREFERFYGPEFFMPVPTGSAPPLGLGAIADDLSQRLVGLFLQDGEGRRPFQAGDPLAASDPAFDGLIQFNEYFHGGTGRGLGASHQTGWTGLVALLIAEAAKEKAP